MENNLDATDLADFEFQNITTIINESSFKSSNSSAIPYGFPELETYQIWAFAIIFTSITVLGMLGNTFVVWAIVAHGAMRSSLMNLLLVNLAVADFGNLLMSAVDWTQILWNRAPLWVLHPYFCQLLRQSEIFFLYASVLMQVAAAIERYIAIIYPFRVGIICSKRKLLVAVLVVWLFAACSSIQYSFYSFFGDIITDSGKRGKICLTNPPKSLKIAECLIFYFLPLFLLCVLYLWIARILWASERSLNLSLTGSGKTAALNRLSQRKSVVKMLFTCVATYFICFSPIQAIFFLNSKMSFPVFICLNGLCYASSACNPIIYTLFSQRFRDRFKDMVSFRCIEHQSLLSSNNRHDVTAVPTTSPPRNGVGERSKSYEFNNARRTKNLQLSILAAQRPHGDYGREMESGASGSSLNKIRKSSGINSPDEIDKLLSKTVSTTLIQNPHRPSFPATTHSLKSPSSESFSPSGQQEISQSTV